MPERRPPGAPDISVVIPARDEEAFVATALASLETQRLPLEQLEAMVVANGCADRTADAVRTFAAQHPDLRLRLVELPTASVSAAKNRGAAEARGHLLLFLDADSRVAPDLLPTIWARATAGERAASIRLVGGGELKPEPDRCLRPGSDRLSPARHGTAVALGIATGTRSLGGACESENGTAAWVRRVSLPAGQRNLTRAPGVRLWRRWWAARMMGTVDGRTTARRAAAREQEATMDALFPWHLVLLVAIVLLVLGPGKLPETGAAIGRAMREFRNAVEGTWPPSPDGDGTRRA
ncbi:MAG: glycosyltransferase [Candidatus Limnocylindrales bacterium]